MPNLFMKRAIQLSIIVFLITNLVFAQTKNKTDFRAFTVIVDVSSIQPCPGTVYFNYFKMSPEGFKMNGDSLEVISGKAIIKGKIDEPSLAILQTKILGPTGRFMLVPGITRIKIGKDASELSIPGSPYQKDLEFLFNTRDEYQKKVLEPLAMQYDSLMKKKDTLAAKLKFAEFSSARDRSNNLWKQYAIDHAKTSPLSVFSLKYAADSGLPGIDSVYNLLAPSFKKFPTAQNIKEKLDQFHKIAIGQPAPLFSQPDTSGKQIELASFKGKYVLVDFWASWCHPCREESPFLIKAYEKYHEKNFEILSISLDSKSTQSAWMKAIHDDKTSIWTHVSDLQGWKNAASTLYGINAIPRNFLVDPTGKIIATDLRGDDIEKKLSEVLNAKVTPDNKNEK